MLKKWYEEEHYLMNDFTDILNIICDNKIALYGLGYETKLFLARYGNDLSIVGLLDGFRTEGEMYDYPIIPIELLPEKGVKHIVVIARPGSCKAIAKRIGGICRENDIELFDVRGKNLLDVPMVTYDFKNFKGATRNDLINKADEVDVISFDLFDTLVMRKTMTYTDIFEILDIRLQERGIFIPDFCRKRLYAEKELSKKKAPSLKQIYDLVINENKSCFVSSQKLAEMEWQLDSSLMTPRTAVVELFQAFVSKGKRVVITTDNYYSKEQVVDILEELGLVGYENIFVSCEYQTSKTQNLYEILREKYNDERILHIGDDEYVDIEKAEHYGIETFRLFSASDLFEVLGGLDIENEIVDIADRVKAGLFIARLFNDPFCFECNERRLSVNDASDVGHLFCAPMITDFLIWLKGRLTILGYEQILFGARDGYLLNKLYKMIDVYNKSYYFITSRTVAIRAGMETQEDISYVEGMKYSGKPEEALKVRFGIEVEDINEIDYRQIILNKAKLQRSNYQKYIKNLGIGDAKIAFFDFVAKGTTQMYLQKLFSQHMKGFYFLRLEPEFMKDKDIDIEPFYSDEEKDTSVVFDNYYVLETLLTAPFPQVEEMDDRGKPVYAKETRNEKDLEVLNRAQGGIIDFFEDYLKILPESVRKENKKLDEKLLNLINRVKILDEDFLAQKVEDPFFGRMTNIKDVLG